ncbi:ATPase [Aureococcus anophagefferens]|nr:ATPase [Aureococcus anophagefferens]
MDDATSIATSDNRSSVGAQSVLARDWTVTAHEVSYATGEGKLLLDEVTAVIPGSSACALVGPSVADKGALLRLLGGAARGGYFSGRVAFAGQPHHEASLLCVFAEAPPGGEGEARSLLGGGGGGRVEGSLSPAEAVAFAAALSAAAAKGHRFARGAASRAEAVVAPRRRAVHGPGDLRRGPVPGLAGGECLVVAGALEALAARGHTVIASLDSDGLSEAAFEAAFSRSVVLRNGRVLYCGETRRAAAHCARCFADGDGARFGLARAEQEAAHVEPLDEERGALHWLAPPVVAPAARFRTLVYRDLARHGRPFGVAVAERHAGAVAVALLWGVAFWDVAAVGADHLSAWALTSVAFASGNVVVAAMLASAPQICRRHGDFERDRRAGKYGALEHVAARSALLVLESACVAVAPTALYLMAGLPFGVALALVLEDLSSPSRRARPSSRRTTRRPCLLRVGARAKSRATSSPPRAASPSTARRGPRLAEPLRVPRRGRRRDGFLSLSARETVALALGLAHGRAVDASARAEDAGAEPLAGYRARTPEGALAPPPTAAAAAAWLGVVLDVAGVARQAQLGPVAYGGGGDESPALHRRRVALARPRCSARSGARADRGMLGAAIGAPLANAALLCGAFWGQGHDDARSVLWLNYCLLAAFATPAALQFPRHAALARAFEHERAAGLVGAPAFFLASLAAPLPLTLLRALLVVPVVYAAANFVVDGAAVAVAVLACGAAGLAAQALALACCWAYVAQTNASALGLGRRTPRRPPLIAAARRPRALLPHAMSTPQLRDKAAPGRYETDGGANFYADARRFVGYSHGTTADGALLSGVVYGPVVLTAVALLGLFRLLYVQRH